MKPILFIGFVPLFYGPRFNDKRFNGERFDNEGRGLIKKLLSLRPTGSHQHGRILF